jgi:hypothetical protein
MQCAVCMCAGMHDIDKDQDSGCDIWTDVQIARNWLSTL